MTYSHLHYRCVHYTYITMLYIYKHIYAYICVTQRKSQSTYLKDIQFYLLTTKDDKPISRPNSSYHHRSSQIIIFTTDHEEDNSVAFVALESSGSITFDCCRRAYLTINQLLYNYYLPPKPKTKKLNKWNNYLLLTSLIMYK